MHSWIVKHCILEQSIKTEGLLLICIYAYATVFGVICFLLKYSSRRNENQTHKTIKTILKFKRCNINHCCTIAKTSHLGRWCNSNILASIYTDYKECVSQFRKSHTCILHCIEMIVDMFQFSGCASRVLVVQIHGQDIYTMLWQLCFVGFGSRSL